MKFMESGGCAVLDQDNNQIVYFPSPYEGVQATETDVFLSRDASMHFAYPFLLMNLADSSSS
jgi:hypothetical protein